MFIEQQPAGLEFVEACNQPGYRGLTCSGVANQCQALSRCDSQREVIQDRFFRLVVEREPVELDRSFERRNRARIDLADNGFQLSIRAKTRSAAERPLCTCVQKEDRLMMGDQKYCRLRTNRYHEPMLTMPAAA